MKKFAFTLVFILLLAVSAMAQGWNIPGSDTTWHTIKFFQNTFSHRGETYDTIVVGDSLEILCSDFQGGVHWEGNYLFPEAKRSAPEDWKIMAKKTWEWIYEIERIFARPLEREEYSLLAQREYDENNEKSFPPYVLYLKIQESYRYFLDVLNIGWKRKYWAAEKESFYNWICARYFDSNKSDPFRPIGTGLALVGSKSGAKINYELMGPLCFLRMSRKLDSKEVKAIKQNLPKW